jgi:hypothetical protein
MNAFRSYFHRLRSLFGRERLERELHDELAWHLEMHIADNLHAGMSPEQARRDALLKLGGVEQTKESYRERRGLPLLESLLEDVCFGLRMLAKSPGFTALAVLTPALGIGADTAIFSLIDTVLLRSLPVCDPEHVVVFKWTAHRSPNTKGISSYMVCPPTNSGALTPRTAPTSDAGGVHGCSFSYPMFREFSSRKTFF